MGLKTVLKATLAGAVTLAAMAGAAAVAQDRPIVGLITKTEGNPFFVKMREGAQQKAAELGLDLRTYAGDFDGDNEGQIAAIESLIAAGAKGFAIVPSDSSAIVPTIQNARDAGLLVIVLDTPLDPIDAADATFATDTQVASSSDRGPGRRSAMRRPTQHLPRSRREPAHGRLPARPGLHGGLRDRGGRPQPLRRRERSAHLRP